MEVWVENIKCGGCANGIQKRLLELEGVDAVQVDIELGQVTVEPDSAVDSEVLAQEVKSTLSSMGYPEVGSVEGIKAARAKAKSYVSCAVGKMSTK